jgi:hypothetical protein
MILSPKIQRAAAAVYPLTALLLAVPILWLAYKNRKEKGSNVKDRISVIGL